MVIRLLAVVLVAFLAGCGSEEPPPTPVPAGQDAAALPPAEMRAIMEGLKSENPRVQHAALETLSRFPAVVQTQREHVERLQSQSRDKRVREKAAELLAAPSGAE